MSEDFDKYLAIANHYIQMVKNMGELELKSYVASILYDNDKKVDMIHELEEENKRLNNIINELEKEIDRLLERQYESERFAKEQGFDTYLPAKENLLYVKNKLQELKGSGVNE